MLGIISNSAGRADAVRAAIDIFTASGASFVIHCGDVGGRHVLDPIARVGGAFVWGDRDQDRMGLMRYARSLDIECYGMMGELAVGEKKIVVLHGDDRKLLKRLLDEQQYDYLLSGHDISFEDRTAGRTRIINPGPLYGGAGSSAVLLEPQSGKMRLLTI